MCLWSIHSSGLRDVEAIAFVSYASEHWVYHARGCGDLLAEIGTLPDCFTDCSKRKTKRLIEKQITALKNFQDPSAHLLEDKEPLLVLLASTGCTDLLQSHMSTCEACQESCSSYDDNYRKALQNALISRWTDTAMMLLESNSNGSIGINALYGRRTLLYRACYFKQTEVITFLLSRGADPTVHSPSGYEYPLHAAIALAQEGIMSILLQHGDVEEQFRLQRKSKTCKGCTALHMALRSQQPREAKLEVLRWLLKKAPRGVGILDLQDQEGISVLDLANQMEQDGDSDDQDLAEEVLDFSENWN
jgi:hypothetical protein